MDNHVITDDDMKCWVNCESSKCPNFNICPYWADLNDAGEQR